MKILLAAGCRNDPDLGVPGVMHSLADRYRSLGHDVRLAFQDRPGRLAQMVFGWRLSRSQDVRWAQIVDVHAVDAWPLCLRRIRPGVVARSHGLELVVHRKLLESARSGSVKIRPIYWTYRGSLRLWFERAAVLRSDAMLVLNRSDLSVCREAFHADPSRLQLVPNGFPPEFLDVPVGTANGVAFVGSWLPRKGNDLAVHAISALLRERPNQRVLVAGTGASAESVTMDFPEDVRDRVDVLAKFRRTDLPKLLEGRGILLFPSRSEGYPLSLVEAMACALAPVATAIPGVVDVVTDGISGKLVAPEDSRALARAMVELQSDPSLLARLRQGARERVRPTGWDSVANTMISLYERILSDRSGKG